MAGPSENLVPNAAPAPRVEKPKGDARQEIRAATGTELQRLLENTNLMRAKKEYLEAHPEVAQGFDRTILKFHSKNIPPDVSTQYESAFTGMRDSLTTAASVMLTKAIEQLGVPLKPESIVAIDREVTTINQWLYTELMKIATTRADRSGYAKVDPTIDLADLQYFGNDMSPAVSLLKTFQENPRDKSRVEAGLRTYLATRLRTASERASMYSTGNDDGKERYFEDFKREIGGIITLSAGQPEAVVDEKSFSKIFDEVVKEQSALQSPSMDRIVSEAREVAGTLFEEVGEDQNGKPIIKAQQDLKNLQAGVEKYLNNHDTSGTRLGQHDSLYQIFYYYILSNALVLGAAGEAIMHHQVPWQTLGVLGATTALASPETFDALLTKTPEEKQLLSADTADEQFAQYPASVKQWAWAIRPNVLDKATPLSKYLDAIRSRGTLESTSEITRFLSQKNTEKFDELGGSKKSGGDYEPLTFLDTRDEKKVMDEHQLAHLTSPDELRKLFHLLQHACQRGGLPSSVRDA